jgi:hypothetical protein
VAQSYRNTGGAVAAADAVELLMGSQVHGADDRHAAATPPSDAHPTTR